MTLKIEEGKYYRTRDGRKVGPMQCFRGSDPYVWQDGPEGEGMWAHDGEDGHAFEDAPDGASPACLIAEWTDEDDPPIWNKMTAEEKGAILLAFHEGKTVEMLDFMDNPHGPYWCRTDKPGRFGHVAYRVKPPEPKREKQVVYWMGLHARSYTIAFETVDGVPDPTTLKVYTTGDSA